MSRHDESNARPSNLRLAAVALVTALLATPALACSPMGAWRVQWGGGTIGAFTQLGFQYATTPNDFDPPAGVLSTIWWGVEDIGSAVTIGPGDQGWDVFVAALTDGHNDHVTLFLNAPEGGGTGYGTTELTAFSPDGSPDFAGHGIEAIRIVLNDVTFDTVDGTFTDYTYDVSFQVISTCQEDLDQSFDVGTNDLLAVLQWWGECPGSVPCEADFDCDGAVGVLDLLQVLASWGPCPAAP